ncbi:MAG TPA: sulfur oxidation c-type cytochrome SoxA [Alphaproteobacteria bacterium]|nr:sulfur oxidation c-type cytochrome SoxA [Alphaproteobacteria bacterium]
MINRFGEIAATVALLVITSLASAEDGFRPNELKSGYYFSRPDTQAIQDDKFSNPGMIYVDRGSELWRAIDGKRNKSCTDCHGRAAQSMTGVGVTYPKVNPDSGELINLGQQIQICRTRNMGALPFKAHEHEHESEDLLALEAYVMFQSQGLPLNVSITGLAAPFFEYGHQLYHQRIGQADLTCSQCHDQRVGHLLRAERISQGHVNGFPTYMLRWDKMASAHRRFQFCNEQARAEPLPLNHPDYNALQLYVSWRGNGLAVETPAVRR